MGEEVEGEKREEEKKAAMGMMRGGDNYDTAMMREERKGREAEQYLSQLLPMMEIRPRDSPLILENETSGIGLACKDIYCRGLLLYRFCISPY